MEIYIGGSGQNKGEIVRLKYDLTLERPQNAPLEDDGALLEFEDIFRVKLVNHFHLLVRRYLSKLSSESKRELFVKRLVRENPKIIMIGDEIGCGIVPLSKEERDYREIYGRLMCYLTKESEKVTRMICGISQVIKDEKKDER